MMIVNVHQAKAQLSQLLVRVESGEDVIIARRGQPVAKLVACKPVRKRQSDAIKGQVTIPDNFFDSLPESELAAWKGQ